MLILDEADEMLNQGFKEQIYDIYRYLPPATQVLWRVCCRRRARQFCWFVFMVLLCRWSCSRPHSRTRFWR
jgi:hypothetical protein